MVAREGRPYELLVADDDAEFRRTLRQVLEPHVELCEAECGEQAVEIVRTRDVDLVLLDMHMHVLTGLDTLRLLKSLRAALPCIIITASFTEELRRSAAEANAFSVLKKPVTRRTLLSTVSLALQTAYDDPEVANWLVRREV
ncbi:MAG: response regulator [Planctomycetia bacterium]|nr:response regulator [Planctomycetia bacterium]